MGEGMQHEIVLTGRAHMNVTGVAAVDCFNEQMVVLDIGEGTLTVSGEGLNISNLDLQQHSLRVSGQVRALEYSDRSPVRGGWLRRIFR